MSELNANHDPDERLDYAVDMTAWLAYEGDTLAAATWTCTDATVQLTPIVGSAATGRPSVWVEPMTDKRQRLLSVTCHMTTAADRNVDRSINLIVFQR